MQAGSYPVVTTVTDFGTTDTLSLAGIAVTISDLGGGGLTTGSVLQVQLVSNTPSIPRRTTIPTSSIPGGSPRSDGQPWVADEGAGVGDRRRRPDSPGERRS